MNQDKIPTAEEIISKYKSPQHKHHITPANAKLFAIEFAKLHVQAALQKEIDELTEKERLCNNMNLVERYRFGRSCLQNVLKFYPLSNIK